MHDRITDGARVHVPHGAGSVPATVVTRQDNGDYLVRLADGTEQTVDGPLLERANPHRSSPPNG
jgi:hypothetical protein